MCNKVKEYLETEGFRFFKAYQNYNKILDEMKSTSPGLYYGQGFITWSQNALTISKLLDDPDYNSLFKKYIDYSKEYNLGEYLINRLETLNNYLKDQSSTELISII
ncbi:MAG: hypothetical protein M9911_05395 [Saprospiraceae bacterium]|nr:hypothetical protein [Saprospiraceae bacterium]